MTQELVDRVVSFDETTGYGFIANRDGGPDVFVHSSDVRQHKHLVRAGRLVQFALVDGERGLRATQVVPLDDSGDPIELGAEPWDVLSHSEYTTELTEALIENIPDLTLGQLAGIRAIAGGLASRRGWVE